jgi:hypothetical protein
MRFCLFGFLCILGFSGIALGDLRFEEVIQYQTGGGSTGVFAADFDGDLDIDYAVANRTSDSITVMYNNGFGMFENIVDFPTGENPRYVEGHDFDGDGDVDLCTPDYYGMTTTILENDGKGAFSISQQFQMLTPTFLWIDDLDLDGHKDIITLHWDSDAENPETSPGVMQPLYSNGDGTFEIGETAFVGVHPRGAASADINGDGLLDIVSADIYSHTISVILSSGSRSWEESFQIFTDDRTPRYILLVDIDGDGDNDIASLDKQGGHFTTYLNDGNASFTLEESLVVNDAPHSMVSTDVDNDGDLDFIVTHVASPTQLILYNDGSGIFDNWQALEITGGAAEVEIADFDSDGLFDIVVAATSNPGASVLLQKDCLVCKGGEACPPISYDINLGEVSFPSVEIELLGESVSGNTLDYILTSLPNDGFVKDSNDTYIYTTPYYLPSSTLTYLPKNGLFGIQFFYYQVNDCLPSNQSIVSMQIDPPFPDECNSSLQIINGYTEISTISATNSTDSYDSTQCDGTNLGDMSKDIWLSYYACQSGELLIDTCGLVDFDTDIVVYKGGCCNLEQIDCNGDTVGCSGNTVLTISPIEEGVEYFIRIGGVNEMSFGTGSVYVEGPSQGCINYCFGDADYNGQVNVGDLLYVIGYWGSDCGDGDINADGMVDVVDLLAVIGSWGSCEN